MKSFNNNEMDFQEKLQKDTEIPVIVHERINQAYRMIENDTVMQKKNSKRSISLDENRGQDCRRYGGSTCSWFYILYDKSGHGKKYSCCGWTF